jgi:hypothetical protein
LRRTFASILAELNAPMRRCMQLLGHTDPKMTVGVDEQVMDMEDDGLQIIRTCSGETLTSCSPGSPDGPRRVRLSQ